jgi:DNA repair protein RecN (Recombination protein N)
MLGRALQELQRLDPGAAPLLLLHEQATATLRDLHNELGRYADRIDLDPARLQELEERLNLIQSLKRKYGATLAEVLAFGQKAQHKLQQLEQRKAELARIQAELQQIDTELMRAGQELSALRCKAILPLRKAVTQQLADLGFKQCVFEIAITSESHIPNPKSQIPLTGLDTIEFQFAPNIGEPARPLRAIASSGEMARVMLALKTVLAAEDEILVLVFDEVDANIGGETAKTVGEKMWKLGQKRQVLCVTHLAPVAVGAAAHFQVTKAVHGGRTISEIRQLQRADRIEELARMLGGQSDAARRHAEVMLKTAAGN